MTNLDDNTNIVDTDGKPNDGLLYETRSGDVQEIIGRMPSWIVRWGITVITLFIAILFVGASFLKYPDVIPAEILITNTGPTFIIKAPVSGQLAMLNVADKSKVEHQQTLAILDNKLNLQLLNNLSRSLQNLYIAEDFKKALSEYNINDTLQLSNLQPYYDDFKVAVNNYKSLMESSKNDYIKDVQVSIKQLMQGIKLWKSKYVIESPMEGTITYLRPLKSKDYVTEGEEIMALNPNQKQQQIVTGRISAVNYNKVKVGQNIRISISTYPSNEFGFLLGKVASISEVNINDQYMITIVLNDLKTTTNHTIPVQKDLKGTAEIVINDKTVLQRLLSKVKAW